jgi:hypothetical protein
VILRRFTDPEAFYGRVEPFLTAHEAENNLVLGIANGVRAGEFGEHPPYMACVEQDHQVVLVALRTPPYGLILSQTFHLEAITPVAENLKAIGETLPGVVAPSLVAKTCADQWQTLSDQVPRPGMAQRIYRLEQVNPVEGRGGTLRPMMEADFELSSRWAIEFHQESLSQEMTLDQARMYVRRFFPASPESRRLFFWVVGGKPVSMAGYSGPTPNGLRVVPVYTPPDLRGEGYATACVAALSQHILDSGRKYCFLFADRDNRISNHVFQQIGYDAVCDVDMLRFEPPSG